MPEYQESDELDELLKRHCLSEFRTGYINIDGFALPEHYKTISADIENLNIPDDDVWVCSFPKTGTTWTQEMVWMISNNLDYVGARKILADRFPFLEVTALFNYTSLMKKIPNFNPPESLTDSVGTVKCLRSPRFVKTHLPWSLLPAQLRNSEKAKIIYVSRNPCDSCVSYFYHSQIIEGYSGDFETFAKLFLAGRLSFAPFIEHVLSFWEHRNNPNILFIKYEEMIKDLPSVIRKVAHFLGRHISEEDVKKLEEHLSFESMKSNPAVNYESITQLNKEFNLTKFDGEFMRKGSVGDYKAHMSQELIDKFKVWTEEKLKGSGFTFEVQQDAL